MIGNHGDKVRWWDGCLRWVGEEEGREVNDRRDTAEVVEMGLGLKRDPQNVGRPLGSVWEFIKEWNRMEWNGH